MLAVFWSKYSRRAHFGRKTDFEDRGIARILLLFENQKEMEMLEEEEDDLKTPSGRNRTIRRPRCCYCVVMMMMMIIIIIMQHVSPKVRYLSTTVHGVTLQRKAVYVCNI